MRVFFAITPDDGLQQACADIVKQQQTHRSNKDVRWTPTDHRHITLKFIDHIEKTTLDQLCEQIQTQLNMLAPFPIETRGLKLLPPRHPHVLALFMQLTTDLAELVHMISTQAEQYNIPLERRAYVPHITLARFKHPSLAGHINSFFNDRIVQVVNRFTLFQSETTDQGSQYTPLQEFFLGGSDLEGQVSI